MNPAASRPIIAVAGAGFSGAVIAYELARRGWSVEVFEARDHVAGNCHTRRDPETGILVHVYGPHIFHTDDASIWQFVQQFDTFRPFTNRVKAIARGQVFSLPVNLHTLNQFFGKTFSPREAEAFVALQADRSMVDPRSFEEQALAWLGRDLYEAFFRGYTEKQWGCSPAELPASILRRLPLRFNYDDNYYSSRYQGLPENGYTHVVERMLDQPGIQLHLNTAFDPAWQDRFAHVFWTGPLEVWFGASEGRLGYRTLDFVVERHEGDFQGNAVINYCDPQVPWTRVTEHKHLSPWESHAQTVVYREFSRSCETADIPYYPIRLLDDKALLARYIDRAEKLQGVTFAGRLGTYRYLDMHVAIAEARQVAALFDERGRSGERMPVFSAHPLARAG